MNEKSRLVNLNVSNNSNLSFSLVKSEKLISFCKENKIKNASTCDYQQFDFINFYFLCRQNKISPIWGIKKILLYRKKPFFVSFFPTTYPNYRFINYLFHNNKVGKFIEFSFLLENFEDLLSKCLFIFEVRSFFDFEEANRIELILASKSNRKELLSNIYIGVNFIPNGKKIRCLLESKLPVLPFYSVKCFSEDEKEYLLKFRSLDMKILGDFKNEDFNQNYFHYLTYEDLEVMIGDTDFVKSIYNNLCIFISEIKISIKTFSTEDKKSDFLEIEKVCNENLVVLNVQNKSEYKDVLTEELNVIKKKNYAGYFNNIRFIVESFRKNSIEVGPGRGSSVSSLVSYLTGITKIDPVKNNLFFWRFLNEKRDDFPDIDVDVNDQERAFEVLVNQFGKDHVSKISTRKSIGLTNLVNISLNFFDLYPDEKSFISENLEFLPKVFKENQSDFKTLRLKAIFERNGFYFEFLKKFQKLIVGLSIHPSGVIVVNNKKLPKLFPVNFAESNKEVLTCSYPSTSLEKLGFKKFDFLSLSESLNFINFMRKKFPDICSYENINFSDSRTWALLDNCLVSHIFQLDSKISRRSLLKISPSCFDDLTLLISLNRPGVTRFASSEKNTLSSSISSDFISKTLSSTQGNILFEEQVSTIISFCNSLDIYQSELVRKTIKKISKEGGSFDEFKESFFQKSSEKVAFEDQKVIFEKIVESAPYMFNKAHAVSYSYLTYYVSYIKANYFEDSVKYFLEKATNINNKKLFLTLSEVFLKGYEIVKPEINSSNYENIFVNKKFILGFSILSKNDRSVFDKIIENREKFGKYSSFRNFIDRNISVLSSYKFENFLPWVETGIFRSLNFDSSLVVENSGFFSNYIAIKKSLSFTSEIPFLNKNNFSFQKKSLKTLNEKDLSSFNCYISYFGRWSRFSQDKKLEIFSLQSALKKNLKYYSNVRIYSVVFDVRKLKGAFLLILYDINSIFEVFMSHKDFEKNKSHIEINNELIFELEIFNGDALNFTANVKKVLEV